MGKNNRKKKQKAKKKQQQSTDTKLEFALSSDIENGANVKSRMQEMLQTLDCQFEEDITCALATISGFVLEETGSIAFFSAGGISKVSSLLVHTNGEIREKAIGTLKNLLLTSEEEATNHLLNNKVVETFTQIFKQANVVFVQNNDGNLLSPEQLQKENNFLVQSLDLFTTLCENSTTVVDSLDLETLLEFFLGILKVETFNIELKVKAAHCLYTISEDNPKLSSLVTAHPTVIKEFSVAADRFIQTDHLLLAILIAGFNYNVCQTSDIQEAMMQLISQCLTADVLEKLKNESDKLKIDQGGYVIQAQCISMEIISNMLCQGSEDDIWNEEEEEHDAETEDPPKSSQPDSDSLENSHQLVQKLRVLNIPEKVLLKCAAFTNSDIPTNFLDSAHKLQIRSWQCLSNILSATPIDVTVPAEIESLWKMTISTLCNEKGGLKDHEVNLLDAVSSTMRAVVEKAVLTASTQIVLEDVVRLSEQILTQDGLLDSTQINYVSMLGMVGKVVAETNNAQVMKIIGGIFAAALSKSTLSLLVAAEVLDATFDSFADGPCVDEALKCTNLLQTLKTLSHTLRSRMNSERSVLAENIGIVDMARLNLNRFLKYKGS